MGNVDLGLGYAPAAASETLYVTDSEAAESQKLTQIANSFNSARYSKMMNVSVYGYISSGAQMNSETEKSERAAMQSRFNRIRSILGQKGVSFDDIWIGGVAFSANWAGQIMVSVKEIKGSSITLPPYTPPVPSKDPQKPSEGREQWIDAEGSVKKDPLEGTIAIEVEISLKEGGIFRTKPPISMKASVKSDGSIELGAELAVIEQEIIKKAAWGAIQEVKFKISVEGGVGVTLDQKVTTELNAAVKASLSANLMIPGTSIKIPVEVSIGVDVEGKPVPGLQFTYKW